VKIEWVTVGPFQENSYLIVDEPSRNAVLVDPGDEAPRIIRMVRDAGVTPAAIWLTHAHLDHVGAIAALKREWDLPVYLHDADLVILRRAAQSAQRYGFAMEQPPDPDRSLSDGDVMNVGALRFTVRHTPGHAPGHVVFHGEGVMLGGDLLFQGSIGRTDLPLSNPDDMETSLALVATFDRNTTVYPGHGPPTNIGHELERNPFLAGMVEST
jgi:glyoxylase-like metal-dependent hydrolase (beta-lactamase superfamily II)